MPATSPLAVPELAFAVQGAAPLRHAAAPTLVFDIAVEAPGGETIRSVLLDVQVQIAARRRRYDGDDQARLFELFGHTADWGTTLRNLLWTRATLVVPGFEGVSVVALHVPCSYDLEVLASRYFDALAGGEVPLEFLFSGTVFYAGAGGALQAARISWNAEAGYRLPVSVWKQTLEAHFRNAAWLRVGKETFDRLAAYRSARAAPSWDAALDALLEEAP